MEIKSLSQLVEKVKSNNTKVLVVAVAEDIHVLEAIKEAYKIKIINPILVGNLVKIKEISEKINFNISEIQIINETDNIKACNIAVNLIKKGEADILMKGLVSTNILLKAILNKETGLQKSGLLSHVALFETKFYHKLIGVTDAAMNVQPELIEKMHIINNAVEVFNRLGIKNPKVAILAAVEVINPKMQATVDAALLTAMNKRGQITNCIVDGPLALDISVSKEAAKHKGIISDVAGNADILVAHDINVGNVLYKSMNFLGGANAAAIIMGAQVPIVLTSRADSEESKMFSIALAAALD
jgi:phosphate butyryltransferase